MKRLVYTAAVLAALSPFFSQSFKDEIMWWNSRTVKCGYFEIDPAWMQFPDGRYGLEFTMRF